MHRPFAVNARMDVEAHAVHIRWCLKDVSVTGEVDRDHTSSMWVW